MPDGVIVKKGSAPGKTLAIFGGVHGNERVGVEVVARLAETLVVERGTVYLVVANPPAVSAGKRLLAKNLNRLFVAGHTGDTYEDMRAQELMRILDACDSLLDIHSMDSDEGEPFVILKDEFDLVSKLDFGIVSFGWDDFEAGGNDSYMHAHGKPSLTVECGPRTETEKYLPLALKTANQFLCFYGAVDNVPYDARTQTYVQITAAAHKKSNDFAFTKEFKTFELLPDGEIFAHDGPTEYRAGKGERILFPRPNKEIGGEVFLLGRDVPKPFLN